MVLEGTGVPGGNSGSSLRIEYHAIYVLTLIYVL